MVCAEENTGKLAMPGILRVLIYAGIAAACLLSVFFPASAQGPDLPWSLMAGDPDFGVMCFGVWSLFDDSEGACRLLSKHSASARLYIS